MDLLLFLFLGGVLGAKSLKDSVKKAEVDRRWAPKKAVFDRRCEEAKWKRDDFYKKYVVPDNSDELAKTRTAAHSVIYPSLRKNYPEAWNVKEEIREVIGEEPNFWMVMLGLLAKQGKTDEHAWKGGFNCTSNGRYYRPTTMNKFLYWYDKELRSHGMEYQLMMVHYKDREEFNFGDFSVAKPIVKDSTEEGRYVWLPTWQSGIMNHTVPWNLADFKADW